MAQRKQTQPVSMRMWVRCLASLTGLWCRLPTLLRSGIAVAVPAAVAPIGPPAWELPYVSGVPTPPEKNKRSKYIVWGVPVWHSGNKSD